MVFTAFVEVASVTDGEGNKTSYSYDGFDRLSRTSYPSTTQGAGTSSTSDYEELGYDANGNVTSRRLRDGNSIAYTYDDLNRLTYKAGPRLQWWETDHAYAYDNLGRLVSAENVGPGKVLAFGYDALGRRSDRECGDRSRE